MFSMFGVWEVLLFSILVYAWAAFCLMTIAEKAGTPESWLAWIPLLNIYLFCKIAGHSGLWVLAILFVPILNIIIAVWFWIEIAIRRNKPELYGILMIVPVVNLLMMGLIAFGDSEPPAVATP